jgi:membrane-bound lytic murein transglycosylase B
VRARRTLILLVLMLVVVPVRPVVAQERGGGTTRPLVAEALADLSPLLLGTEVEGAGYPAAHDAWVEAGEQLALAEGQRVSGEQRTVALERAPVVLAAELEEAQRRAAEAAVRASEARSRMVDVAVGAFMIHDASPRPQSGTDADAERDDRRRALFGDEVAHSTIEAHQRMAADAREAADAEADVRVRLDQAIAEHRAAQDAAADAARRSDGWAEARAQRQAVLSTLAPATRVSAVGLRTVVLDAYARAARHPAVSCSLPWNVLAGIGRVESRHGEHGGSAPDLGGQVAPRIIGIALDGTNNTMEILDTDGGVHDGDVVHDRAVGPMQFIPSTWRRHGVDGNGDGVADPNNLYDAAAGAAAYLCRAMPADGDLRRAIFAYNRDTAYGDAVLRHAESYGALRIPAARPAA